MNLFYFICMIYLAHGFVMDSSSWEHYLLWSLISSILAISAGIFSGCTVGLMGIDKMSLKLKSVSGSDEEKLQARRILPLLADHHLLLVTLLICNALVLETLPIVLEKILGDIYALIVSVMLTLIFGEIIPQALLTGKKKIPIASALSGIIKFFLIIFWPISYPIARVLDKIIGQNNRKKLNNEELKVVFTLQLDDNNRDRLNESQVCIIHNAIDFDIVNVGELVIGLKDVFCLNAKIVLDDDLKELILKKKFSRVPIIDNSSNFIGVLLVKHLLLVESGIRLKDLNLRKPLYFNSDLPIMKAINYFSKGKSHLSFVRDSSSGKVIGILTLEDILKKITQKKVINHKSSYSTTNLKTDENLNSKSKTRRNSKDLFSVCEVNIEKQSTYDFSEISTP